MPSNAVLEAKKAKVEQLTEIIKNSVSGVLVDYKGITVEEDTKLRKELREAGVVYKVYKNTLIKRAIAGTQFEGMADLLEGPTAIAISTDDATAPARVLAENAKKMDALELKGGVVDGTFYDSKMIQVIANIPSREVLLGRLFGSMQSPVANFARVIKQIAESKEEVA